MIKASKYLVYLAFLLLAACDLFGPSRVLVPTTNITLTPPSGYSASLRFQGIENTVTDGSFTVSTFPQQAIGSLGQMFSSVERATPTLNNRGIRVEEVIEIEWNNEKVLLFRGNQKNEDNILYDKWIAVFVDSRPIMMAFQEPRPGKLDRNAIITTFESLEYNDPELDK